MRRKNKDENIRKIVKSGDSYAITIPIEMINKLKWREKQKVVIEIKGKSKKLLEIGNRLAVPGVIRRRANSIGTKNNLGLKKFPVPASVCGTGSGGIKAKRAKISFPPTPFLFCPPCL